jgi:hypothetical protein
MNNTEKQELISQLLKANPKTFFGSIIHNFINDINNKSDNDLMKLVSELKDANADSSEVTKDILQGGYEYIINFQMPTDFAPIDSEGVE